MLNLFKNNLEVKKFTDLQFTIIFIFKQLIYY